MEKPDYNASWLKDAVNKLFVYHTPENVLMKIKSDAIYGNPPFKLNTERTAKPDYNAILAWHELCKEFMMTEYERIARQSGNQETLKAVLARKAEYDK